MNLDLSTVKITPRDREILDLLLLGRSNNEIALALKISPRTVKMHLYKLYSRAGITESTRGKRILLATSLLASERLTA